MHAYIYINVCVRVCMYTHTYIPRKNDAHMHVHMVPCWHMYSHKKKTLAYIHTYSHSCKHHTGGVCCVNPLTSPSAFCVTGRGRCGRGLWHERRGSRFRKVDGVRQILRVCRCVCACVFVCGYIHKHIHSYSDLIKRAFCITVFRCRYAHSTQQTQSHTNASDLAANEPCCLVGEEALAVIVDDFVCRRPADSSELSPE